MPKVSRGAAAQRVSVEALRAEMNLRDEASPVALTQEERIYDMKVAGFSVREIAAGTGLDAPAVEEIINRMVEASRSRMAAELSIATILEIDRMDRLLKALWPLAEKGDFGAVDRVGSISKERRRLLGLDAPEVKASLNINTGSQVDLSGLSLEELKQWEAIQMKLSQAQGKRLAPKSKGRVIDVEPD